MALQGVLGDGSDDGLSGPSRCAADARGVADGRSERNGTPAVAPEVRDDDAVALRKRLGLRAETPAVQDLGMAENDGGASAGPSAQ